MSVFKSLRKWREDDFNHLRLERFLLVRRFESVARSSARFRGRGDFLPVTPTSHEHNSANTRFDHSTVRFRLDRVGQDSLATHSPVEQATSAPQRIAQETQIF